jgi:hypothetical protein
VNSQIRRDTNQRGAVEIRMIRDRKETSDDLSIELEESEEFSVQVEEK